MNTLPQDQALTDRLLEMTDTIGGPPPTDIVIRRGRTKVRRGRAIGAAATLSVFSTAAAFAVATGLIGGTEEPQHVTEAASAPSAFVSTNGDARPVGPGLRCDSHGKFVAATAGKASHDTEDYAAELDGYRNLLVEHLDPQGGHLQEVQNVQSSGEAPCALTSLGTKLGWTSDGGGEGLGMVRVEVTSAWDDAQVHLAHEGWLPAETIPPGTVNGYVAEYPGGTAVAITRADGTTVALDVASLFGNNSETPVAGMDLDVDGLLEAAADPGFQLP